MTDYDSRSTVNGLSDMGSTPIWSTFLQTVKMPGNAVFMRAAGHFLYPLKTVWKCKNRIKQIISAIVVAFGDKNELLLLQIAGKLDYVFFTNEERLLGASALIV